MKKDTISIIVPSYNSEKYISKCVESLVNQTYSHKEIIVVNDGSTDKTLQILRKLKEKYSEIIIIDKKNGGVSSARNIGIENASGKYIMFVDSDDWCEPQMCEEMIKLANKNNYDMVCCGYYMDSDNGNNLLEVVSKDVIEGDDVNNIGIILNKCNISYCVTKLYNKEIINNNNIRFNEELSMGEDAVFTCDYILQINRIALINKAYYHYVRANNESLSTKYINDIDIFIKMVWDRLELLYDKYPKFRELEHKDGSSRAINSSKMYIYNNYRKGCKLSSIERQKYIKYFMDDKNINDDMKNYRPKSFIDKLYYILYKIKSPFIMDLVYSLRIYIVKVLGVINGVKK